MPVTEKRQLTFHRADHTRYDYREPSSQTVEEEREQKRLVETLDQAMLFIPSNVGKHAQALLHTLPKLINRYHPTTVEFVSYSEWRKSKAERQMLRGMILRDKDEKVLLYAYGVGLGWNDTHQVKQIFALFEFSTEYVQLVKDAVSSSIDYSIIIELS